MKRIFVSVLCLCLCVTAAACGRPDVTPETSDLSVVSDVSTTTTATTTTEESTTTTQETTTTTVTTTTTATSTTTTTTVTTTTTKLTTTTMEQELTAYALGQTEYKADADSVYDGYTDGMSGYYSRVLPQFLSGDESENRVCSPLNVYLALAMLAESAAGDSRQQLLDLLGEADTEALSRRTAALWNSVYSNKEGARCLAANSIWLNQPYATQFSPQTIERLNQKYYASAFSGVMGTPEYDTRLQDWINDNTGGLLK